MRKSFDNIQHVPRTAQIQPSIRLDQVGTGVRNTTPVARAVIVRWLLRAVIVLGCIAAFVSGFFIYTVMDTMGKVFVGSSGDEPRGTVVAVIPPPDITPEVQATSTPRTKPQPTGTTGQIPAATLTPVATPSRRINIVLLGVDQRAGEPANTARADTIMVLTIDPQTKSAGLLSFPRDLLVQIPGYYSHKINVAHSLGGPALVKKTLEQNFGIRADYFVRVNFNGFTRMVDAFGGIDINVPKVIHDTAYPVGDTNAVMTVHFNPGMQHMDGSRALIYARTRHADSDFGRIERQQQVLMALRAKALQGNTLLRWHEILLSLGDTVQTDIPITMVPGMIALGQDIDSSRIVNRAIDATMVTAASSPQLGEYLLPRWNLVRAVIKEVFEPTPAG